MKLMKQNLPCRKCANILRPFFVECLLEKLDYGLVSYEEIRPDLITVIAKDIPHSDCRLAIINNMDRANNYYQN